MLVGTAPGCVIPSGVSILAVAGLLPGLFGGIVATGLGLAATISGVRGLIDRWRLSTTDSVPMDEAVASDEVVQVRGHVRPSRSGDTLVSPIRDDECVAYEYKINHQILGFGDPSIDSGVEYSPFVLSDGTAEILVDPTAESLSLRHERDTVTGGEELLERVDEAKLDLDPSVHGENSGVIKDRIEMMEGTISIGERITVLGKATPATERVAVDADAVMAPEALTVMNADPRTTTLRTGARDLFLLGIGLTLTVLGVTALSGLV